MAAITETNGDAGNMPTSASYTISLGDVFQGSLGPGDESDLVAVTLNTGTIIDITLAAPAEVNIALLDADGNRVVNGSVNADGAKIILDPPADGTYYIRAQGAVDEGNVDYEISFSENTIPVGTYDVIADYLTDGFWMRDGGTGASFDVGPDKTLTVNLNDLPDQLQPLARWALDAWTHVSGIRFVSVEEGDANIMFTYVEGTISNGGWTSLNRVIIEGFVNIAAGDTVISDRNTLFVIMHEIGHALGLGHPGPYPKNPDNPYAAFGVDNLYLIDSQQSSLMSYIGQHANTYINGSPTISITPMVADILAIQILYGIPEDSNGGDTVYGHQSSLDGYSGYLSTMLTGDYNPFYVVDTTSFSHTALVDIDGDGDLDLIVGKNHINSDRTDYEGYDVYFYENTGTALAPEFSQRTGEANPLADTEYFVNFSITFADIDADGDEDLFIGNLYYYENTGTWTNPVFAQRTGTDNPLHATRSEYYKRVLLPDLDGDGDLDMVAVKNDGTVLYFENTGTATEPELTQHTGEGNPLDHIKGGENERISPDLSDLDGDGDLDLTIGRSNGVLDYYENTGTDTAPAFTQRTGESNPFDDVNPLWQINPAFADIDNDGDLDLVAGDVWGDVTYFENTGAAATPEFNTVTQAGQRVAMTLYDTGGKDTLDLHNDNQDQRVDLRPEGISDVYGFRGNLVIARDTIIENYVGGSGNDTITGNDADNVIEGRAGADFINGGHGSDTAAYTGSPDPATINLADGTITGGHAEGDSYASIENLTGSAHDDTLTGDASNNVLDGAAGADALDGREGSDTAAYMHSDAAVTVDLSSGTISGGHAEGDTLTSIENLTGSRHNDVLVGDAGTNRLDGGPGHDRLDGRAGADTLIGDLGSDTAIYTGSAAAVAINLLEGTAMGGDAEGDTLTDIENLIGSAHDDALTGDADDNLLEGGAGADTLDGGEGIDTASYAGSGSRVDVRLSGTVVNHGDATGDTLSNIENLTCVFRRI